MDQCIATGIEHDLEYKTASFGQHSFQCKLCGMWFDEMEDSQP